jgi:RNA polymerase sigma factor for flagellar operon FliA
MMQPALTLSARRLRKRLPRSAIVDAGDLAAVGALGVMDAIERFDPARRVRFATFAAGRINGAMLDHLRSIDFVPRRERQLQRKGLVKPVGMCSLNKPMTRGADDEGVPMERGDFRAAPAVASPDPDDGFRAMLVGFNRTERLLLTLYYREEMSMKEIGAVLGVSESRVSQMHKSLIARLKARGRPAADGERLMASNSSIEWTDATWNPTTGCTRASAGCDHCYAVKMTHRLELMGNAQVRGADRAERQGRSPLQRPGADARERADDPARLEEAAADLREQHERPLGSAPMIGDVSDPYGWPTSGGPVDWETGRIRLRDKRAGTGLSGPRGCACVRCRPRRRRWRRDDHGRHRHHKRAAISFAPRWASLACAQFFSCGFARMVTYCRPGHVFRHFRLLLRASVCLPVIGVRCGWSLRCLLPHSCSHRL